MDADEHFRRIDATLDRISGVLVGLAESQARFESATEERFDSFERRFQLSEQRFERLEARQAHFDRRLRVMVRTAVRGWRKLDHRMNALIESQLRTDAKLERLIDSLGRHDGHE